jgi:hypothetical protein
MGYELWPAFTTGIKDSLNPFWIAGVLFFVLLLSTEAHTRNRAVSIGLFFIVSAGMTQYWLTRGLGDPFFTQGYFLNVVAYYYLLVALIFFIIGGLNWSDWWGYKNFYNTDRFRFKLPVFLRRPEGDFTGSGLWVGLNLVRSVFLAFFTGMVFTFTASIAPQDKYIYILYSHLLANGDMAFVNGSYILYSLGFVVPSAVIWMVVVWLTAQKEQGSVFISYYKGVSAIVFLLTGLGLTYWVSQVL